MVVLKVVQSTMLREKLTVTYLRAYQEGKVVTLLN